MLAAFAARLTEELDADTVTGDLARSVHAALEPAHLSIWSADWRYNTGQVIPQRWSGAPGRGLRQFAHDGRPA
jgi:hypothetical protein